MVKVSRQEAETTSSGSANAAELTLGSYRQPVDIVVNGSGSGWTVTVEVKDANDDWIQFATFSQDGSNDDVLQFESVSPEVRAYYDTDVNRLTMYSEVK